MKIATYNVNSVNARLPVLLRWLAESQPDVACLQELKAAQEKFPADVLREAGYPAIWHGQKAWNGVAVLARAGEPAETGRGLAGDPDDVHSRYLEGTVAGVRVGCLCLPNGNPAPGLKFDYKLRWLERLTARAAELVGLPEPIVLAGDYNVIPEELDVYNPAGWEVDALFRPESRAAYRRLLDQGWTDAVRRAPQLTSACRRIRLPLRRRAWQAYRLAVRPLPPSGAVRPGKLFGQPRRNNHHSPGRPRILPRLAQAVARVRPVG